MASSRVRGYGRTVVNFKLRRAIIGELPAGGRTGGAAVRGRAGGCPVMQEWARLWGHADVRTESETV